MGTETSPTRHRVRLDVPLIGQVRDKDCWYAAVNMVCKFHVEGPRNGVPTAWRNDEGLPFADFSTLARGEHLIPLKYPQGFMCTEENLSAALKAWGPIWAWGMWFGASHIVVLTGVERGTVFMNDPDGPRRKEMGLADFNTKLERRLPPGTAALMVYRHPNVAKLQRQTADG